MMLPNPTLTPCASIGQVLEVHDSAFITRAYQTLLRRAPDASGLRNYLGRLRSGDTKAEIIAEIAVSAEARELNINVEGLRELVSTQAKTKSPLWRIFPPSNPGNRQLQRLENLLGQIVNEHHQSSVEANTRMKGGEQAQLHTQRLAKENIARIAEKLGAYSAETNSHLENIDFALRYSNEVHAADLNRLVHAVSTLASETQRIENLLGQIVNKHRESIVETDMRMKGVELAQLRTQGFAEENIARIAEKIGGCSAETNSHLENIAAALRYSNEVHAADLSRLAEAVSTLEAQMNSSNLRLVESFESLEHSGVSNKSLPGKLANSNCREYEEAIKPISVSHMRATTAKFSIIILQFHKSELTVNCVRSLMRHTRLDDVEIMVVDNGSAPEHIANLRTEFQDLVTIIEIGINRYFGEGNNIGADRALGEFLVFMNNDIVVTRNWLGKLSPHLKDDVDLVGPAFLYPDGRVQECGAYIGAEAQPIQQFKGGAVNDMLRAPFECDYISAATILLKKETFLKVGGFDLCYEPAYYEDVDLCLKIASFGGKIICVPEVQIFHCESATSSDETLGLGPIADIASTSAAKFLGRWKMFLSDRVRHTIKSQRVIGTAVSPIRVIQSEIVSKKRGKVILFSPYPLTPGGGEKYLLTIAQVLSTHYQTTLAFEFSYSTSRMRQLESYLNLDLSKVSLMDFTEACNQEWDISFVVGDSIAPPFPKLAPMSFYICQRPFERSAYFDKPIPYSNDYHYICYSDFVKNNILIAEYIQPSNVTILPPVVQTYQAAATKEKLIISVGRFSAGTHCKKQLLLIEAFKKLVLHSDFKDWKLILVGATRPEDVHRTYYTQCVNESQGFNVEIIPDASFDALSSVYGRASIYWHGSGLGVDPFIHPEQLEHLGVTPLEAASADCHIFIPDAGGHRQMARKAPARFHLYSSIDELIETTISTCRGELFKSEQSGDQVRQLISTFDLDTFNSKLSDLITLASKDVACGDASVIRPNDYRVQWSGWSNSEHSYRWSCQHESKIQFLWGEVVSEPALITLEFQALGFQRVLIQLNGNLLLDATVSSENQFLTFEATGLKCGFNSLVFSFPNARQSGSGDPRIAALALRSLTFINAAKKRLVLTKPNFNTTSPCFEMQKVGDSVEAVNI